MIIDCVADLHGNYPELHGGDLLIVAGDVTSNDKLYQYIQFYKWIEKQEYKKKIVISGNHDNYFQKCNTFSPAPFGDELAIYLCDSGTEFESLKIWGSPWTKTFDGMNPKCKAFTVDIDEELDSKFSLIPDDVDVLITHCPPWGIFDLVPGKIKGTLIETGSMSLRNKSMDISPKVHVFGHIHEHGGKIMDSTLTKFINASIVNEHYQPVNKPVRVIL